MLEEDPMFNVKLVEEPFNLNNNHKKKIKRDTYHAVAQSHDLADSHFRADQNYGFQIAILRVAYRIRITFSRSSLGSY